MLANLSPLEEPWAVSLVSTGPWISGFPIAPGAGRVSFGTVSDGLCCVVNSTVCNRRPPQLERRIPENSTFLGKDLVGMLSQYPPVCRPLP